VNVSPAISANSVLPARRVPLTLRTEDGLSLVGEAALPRERPPRATLVCVHPLPTHGGMMDSHVLRKAAWRLPALADIAVIRFNTRGTTSAAGTSEGAFDQARGEGLDLAAAVQWARNDMPALIAASQPTVSPEDHNNPARIVAQPASQLDAQPASQPGGLRPSQSSVATTDVQPWLLGWSFGTDVILKHGLLPGVLGAILLSPPLRFTSAEELRRWTADGRPVVALVPEHDDFLPPAQARAAFEPLHQVDLRPAPGAKHLWVGETWVRWVLDTVVSIVAPEVPVPLPSNWDGPMERWNDLKGTQ
jgi:uncharacterized protein